MYIWLEEQPGCDDSHLSIKERCPAKIMCLESCDPCVLEFELIKPFKSAQKSV